MQKPKLALPLPRLTEFVTSQQIGARNAARARITRAQWAKGIRPDVVVKECSQQHAVNTLRQALEYVIASEQERDMLQLQLKEVMGALFGLMNATGEAGKAQAAETAHRVLEGLFAQLPDHHHG